MAAITSVDESKKKIDRFLKIVLDCLTAKTEGTSCPYPSWSYKFPAMEQSDITHVLRVLHTVTRGNTMVDFMVSVRLEAGVPGYEINIEKRKVFSAKDAIRQLNLLLDNPPKKDSFDEATTTLLIRED